MTRPDSSTRFAIAALTAVTIAAGAHPGGAQVFQAPPGQGGGSAPASGPSSSGGQGGSSRGGGDGQLFGDLLPFVNPGSEIVSWNGQNWSVMDQRVFSSRFEKYLNAPESATEEDRAYREVIDAILAELSPHNSGGPDLQGAVALLPKASSFPIDARLCDSLSSAIYSVYLSQRNVAGINMLNTQMDEQRRQLEWNIEVAGEGRSLAPPEEKDGKAQPKSPEQLALELGRLSGYIKRVTEIEVMKQANRAKVEITAIKAKVEYQALIIQFFLQRRFEHVIMATRIYRSLFEDGDSELAIEEGSDVEKLFGQSLGVNPTISSIDAFASEAIRDVDEAVDAFRFLVEKEELQSASKRLAEAFMVGEYLEKVRTLPREEKRRVLGFVRDSNQLLSALDVKDYTLAEELVERMRETARDFDYSKPMAAINTARTVADMQLSKAKNAMIRGDQQGVDEAVRNATEVWPTNPKLREFGEVADEGANIKNQALIDLKGLIAQKNFRQIYDDQPRYLLAVRDDPEMQETLRRIIEDVTRINMVIVQAEKLGESGNQWAAWEEVEKMAREFPDDSELNRRRADLSSEVAPFVHALRTAGDLEQKDQVGSSLAWFLKARKIYPNSDFASQGIDRLVAEILPDEDPVASAATPGTPPEGGGDGGSSL